MGTSSLPTDPSQDRGDRYRPLLAYVKTDACAERGQKQVTRVAKVYVLEPPSRG